MRRSAVVGTLLVLWPLGVPALVDAGPAPDPQHERELVAARRVDTALKIDAFTADESQLRGALADLDLNVRRRAAQLRDAEEAERGARATAAGYERQVTEKTDEFHRLQGRLRVVALRVYVAPPVLGELTILSAKGFTEAERTRALVDVSTSRDADLVDRVTGLRSDLQTTRRHADAAVARAAQKDRLIRTALTDVTAARDQRKRLVAAADDRLNASLAESASLATVDARLSAEIIQRQQALAEEVARVQVAVLEDQRHAEQAAREIAVRDAAARQTAARKAATQQAAAAAAADRLAAARQAADARAAAKAAASELASRQTTAPSSTARNVRADERAFQQPIVVTSPPTVGPPATSAPPSTRPPPQPPTTRAAPPPPAPPARPPAPTPTTRPPISQPPPEPAPRPGGSVPLVDVRGIVVNVSIGPQLAALLSAADAAGFNFTGGGYRDSAQQIALRRAHCGPSDFAIYEMSAAQCHPPTARPGSSMHEQGLAVDFAINGSAIGSHSDPAFQWMAANAARFGFYNLASEPWHWSTNGD